MTTRPEGPALPVDPPYHCPLCPRLVAFHVQNRLTYPDFHNGPVPYWGDPQPSMLIVGLAPGLKGANKTGRPFTGDFAGDLLFQTLAKFGRTRGTYDARPDDGLELVDTGIVNAVRCVPPQNKPTPAEINTCRRFLVPALEAPGVKAIVALGRIAHDSILSALDVRKATHAFGHGAEHALPSGATLFDSYHCSRYNTNTRRLTTEMFEDVIGAAAQTATG